MKHSIKVQNIQLNNIWGYLAECEIPCVLVCEPHFQSDISHSQNPARHVKGEQLMGIRQETETQRTNSEYWGSDYPSQATSPTILRATPPPRYLRAEVTLEGFPASFGLGHPWDSKVLWSMSPGCWRSFLHKFNLWIRHFLKWTGDFHLNHLEKVNSSEKHTHVTYIKNFNNFHHTTYTSQKKSSKSWRLYRFCSLLTSKIQSSKIPVFCSQNNGKTILIWAVVIKLDDSGNKVLLITYMQWLS